MPTAKQTSTHLYLLTKLFLWLGIFTLLLSLVFVTVHYRNYVQMRMQGYQQLLTTLESSYLYELMLTSERQLSALAGLLDRKAIARGESAYSPAWVIAHQIQSESQHYVYFYNVQTQRIDSYPAWRSSEEFDASLRPWYRVLESHSQQPQWVGPYKEYSSQQLVLTLAQVILDENGQILGLLLVDMPMSNLNRVLARVYDEMDVSLFLRHQDSGALILAVNQDYLNTEIAAPNQENVAFSGLLKGAMFLKPLSYADWELGIYIPPQRFRRALQEQFILLLLPVAAITLVTLLGIYSLIRLFRQELALVEQELRRFCGMTPKYQELNNHEHWFVNESLNSLKQQYLSHRLNLRMDPLTGIANRRAFDEDLLRLVTFEQDFALILVDVDRFKQINDTFGHQVGDIVLRRVAELLVTELGLEQVYRIGGDEFAALLPLNNRGLLCKQLQKLNDKTQEVKWREQLHQATLSIGAAIGPGELELLFAQADAALYRSKRAGRNCWHID
ncbi:diguanylate cyclase [Shewanella algae]